MNIHKYSRIFTSLTFVICAYTRSVIEILHIACCPSGARPFIPMSLKRMLPSRNVKKWRHGRGHDFRFKWPKPISLFSRPCLSFFPFPSPYLFHLPVLILTIRSSSPTCLPLSFFHANSGPRKVRFGVSPPNFFKIDAHFAAFWMVHFDENK